MKPLPLLALFGLGGLLFAAGRGSSTPGKVIEPGAAPQGTAPPILANGTLGHTNQPAGLFWGLPLDLIWRIDNAYYAGDQAALSAAATAVSTFKGFEGLAGLLATDAKNLTTPVKTT